MKLFFFAGYILNGRIGIKLLAVIEEISKLFSIFLLSFYVLNLPKLFSYYTCFFIFINPIYIFPIIYSSTKKSSHLYSSIFDSYVGSIKKTKQYM